MAHQPASLILRTPVFRMSYPNLVTPKPYKDPRTQKEGDPEFTAEMMFDPEVLDKFETRRDDAWEQINIKAAMGEVCKAEWPDLNLREAVQYKALNWPLKDGDQKKAEQEAKGKKAEHYTGTKVLTMKAKEDYPPNLWVFDKGDIVQLDRSDDGDMKRAKDLFVGGHYAKAFLNLKAIETAQGKYLVFYCNDVLFVKPGQKIGGMSAAERFGGIDGGMSDYDPTGGLPDEMPAGF